MRRAPARWAWLPLLWLPVVLAAQEAPSWTSPAAALAGVPEPGRLVELESFPAKVGPNAGHYVDARTLPAVKNFPPPPAPGSATQDADLAELHRWQDARTGADCDRAKAEEIPSFDALFGALHPFGAATPADAEQFFSWAGRDLTAAGGDVKDRFQRARPPRQDPTLEPCAKLPSGFSYPSSHAAVGRLYALILSDLSPSRRAEFMARGDEAGLDRVIAGVHFPSDVEAGRRLGDAVYAALRASSAFNADLDALRSEIAR